MSMTIGLLLMTLALRLFHLNPPWESRTKEAQRPWPFRSWGGFVKQPLNCIGSLVLASVLLLGCSPSETDEPQQKRFGRLSYDIGDCQRSPFDGAEFTGPISQGPRQPLRLFNKDFYLQGLEATLNASSYSIANSLFNEGVEILQVKSFSNADLACRYFDFLPEARGVAQSQWDSVASPNGGASALLGLFTTIYSKNSQTNETRLKNPTIMVIDQTQKWTLLHEMSHYLFAHARSRQNDLTFNSELETIVETENTRIQRLVAQLQDQETQATAKQLMQTYVRFFRTNFELDKRTALEEFAVEGLLIDYAKQNRITDVDIKSEAQQAYLYMKRNGESVAFSYVLFLDRLRDFQELVKRNQWTATEKAVDSLISEIKTQVDFINDEIEAASIYRDQQPTLPDSFREWVPARPHYDLKNFKRRHQMIRNSLGNF